MIRTFTVAALVGILALAPLAHAGIDGAIFEISAMDEMTGESGSWAVTAEDLKWDETVQGWCWSLAEDVSIVGSGGSTLATLKAQSADGTPTGMTYIEDPQVNLNFAVQAGNVNTVFSMASALLSFPTIANAVGQASAAFTVTDFAGTDGGATLTGLTAQGGAYTAHYNGFAGTNSGTPYTPSGLIAGLAAPAFGTNNASAALPPIGTNFIGSVSDISSAIKFRLSRFDLASGTSVFVVTPEPTSLLLLGLGLVFARRR